MREERRHGHMPSDVTRGAAEHRLAHARVTVGAHYQKIGIEVGKARQDLIADADVRRDRGPYRWLDAVPCQRGGDRGVGSERFLVSAVLDLEYVDVLRRLQQGERVEYRACGFAARFPSDHDVACDSRI